MTATRTRKRYDRKISALRRDERVWLPIKTAPKDGPTILGCLVVEDMHHFVLVRWDDGAWRDEYGNEYAPDYWQSLPEPPSP